ncbi:Protein Jade-1 [Bulinus truncatus]|nr:Protein Jade-1 [Bulinus truncatus]
MPYTKGSKKNTGKREDSPEPGTSKKAKYSSDEDEQPVMRKGKCQSSKMISKQGKMSKKSPNVISKASGPQNSHNKPAELFRKDLISAMKMADTEILFDDEYLVISDPWRQEWEKGVQVPVNEEEIPPSVIGEVKKKSKTGDFKLPHRKFLHEKQDETYQATHHELTHMQELAEQIVRYDLDDQDVTWLELVNEDREEMGLQVINEWNMERMIEELENQCYVKTNALKKTEEGLGIEYDEDVACDVCHMLESEDTNEMVFCDGCDICVHQACYGIQTIPEGSWLCRICALGIKPMCLLCPKRGGAMKSTKSGTKWTHVSCALWIPEVSIGCPEKNGTHNQDLQHTSVLPPAHQKNRNASDCESPKEEDPNDTQSGNGSHQEKTRKVTTDRREVSSTWWMFMKYADKFFVPEEAVDIVAEYWKLKDGTSGGILSVPGALPVVIWRSAFHISSGYLFYVYIQCFTCNKDRIWAANTTPNPPQSWGLRLASEVKLRYSSLVEVSNGVRSLFANCTDDVIYEYDMAGYKSTPAPVVLKSHASEVTSVAWCPNDLTKVVTLSDDTKEAKFWRVCCSELEKKFPPSVLWKGRGNFQRMKVVY